MPSFLPHRSTRNRRWHPKYSLSPRESSAPAADAAITGTALSPAARLMAAAVPPLPTRNALPSTNHQIAEARPPSAVFPHALAAPATSLAVPSAPYSVEAKLMSTVPTK